MKSIVSLLLLANTCLAVPAISTTSPLYIRNGQCNKKGDLIATVYGYAGPVSVVVAYTTAAGTFTRSVCRILNDHRGISKNVCDDYAAAVSSATLAILVFVETHQNDAHYQGSKAEKWTAGVSNVTLADRLVASLALQGAEYESLTNLPISAVSRRSADAGVLLGYVLIKNLKLGDMNFDAIQADFGNGDGQLFITPSKTNHTSGALQKRHDGAGFKLSFTTRVHSGLDQGQMVVLSQRIGDSWNWEANNRDMGEWVGLVKLADRHQAVVYIRIIPEVRGYGEEYESVDVCGQLAPFL
jgi:hypothetical protein